MACVLALAAFTVGVAAKADTIEIDGKAVTIERFGDASRKVPAVVLVHGSDGAGERYRAVSRKLAAAGFNVFMVHYLDMTGGRRTRAMVANIPAWNKAVRGAIDHAADQSGAVGRQVGVIGVSFGGVLAVLSAQQDPHVGAVVSYFGYVPGGTVTKRLPPTLILHGAKDRIVPVESAMALQQIVQKQGVPNEIRIFPEAGHGFGLREEMQAMQEVTAFLRRHLGAPQGK
ncbi:dienelactone hydrolase family protein [Roseiarcaceae bacterium H3SJ34-1]|uniref:dienelactone hydrolase family protein n=1 Tax=Terripilifer ovatus TaxID=3032367 RepID=UPI003AB99E25|nr:dienelactone hydrolase family protein [Roseiarcaceae bacterium H3SJ34-1]